MVFCNCEDLVLAAWVQTSSCSISLARAFTTLSGLLACSAFARNVVSFDALNNHWRWCVIVTSIVLLYCWRLLHSLLFCGIVPSNSTRRHFVKLAPVISFS